MAVCYNQLDAAAYGFAELVFEAALTVVQIVGELVGESG